MSFIAYIQYSNPAGYPSLEHSSRMLAENGRKVLFLGTSIAGVEALRFPSYPNIVVRQLFQCRPGWRQKLHYPWFIAWACFRTLLSGCSWAYASDPLSCPAALLLSYVPWIRVVYHEHDSPGESNGVTSHFLRLVFWTRQKLARRAAVCVLPNQQRATQFIAEIGGEVNVVCVWNCPTKDEVSPERLSLNGGDLWVLYHGSLVPSRLPATVLQALKRLPERVKLRAIGYETAGHRGYVEELRTLAMKLGVSHRVEFVGTVPTRDELFVRCRQADVGLAFMPRTSRDINEQAMTGASNKPFDYLACGLALLVSDLPDWRAMYVEAGAGLACDPENADSIAAALQWCLDHPDRMRAMGENGRQRIIEKWNYETQFSPVLSWLNADVCNNN
jgi:glycosyltransferase involved in cell wall biosynthesis